MSNNISKIFIPKKIAKLFLSGTLAFTLVGCGINETHNSLDNSTKQ